MEIDPNPGQAYALKTNLWTATLNIIISVNMLSNVWNIGCGSLSWTSVGSTEIQKKESWELFQSSTAI